MCLFIQWLNVHTGRIHITDLRDFGVVGHYPGCVLNNRHGLMTPISLFRLLLWGSGFPRPGDISYLVAEGGMEGQLFLVWDPLY